MPDLHSGGPGFKSRPEYRLVDWGFSCIRPVSSSACLDSTSNWPVMLLPNSHPNCVFADHPTTGHNTV